LSVALIAVLWTVDEGTDVDEEVAVQANQLVARGHQRVGLPCGGGHGGGGGGHGGDGGPVRTVNLRGWRARLRQQFAHVVLHELVT